MKFRRVHEEYPSFVGMSVDYSDRTAKVYESFKGTIQVKILGIWFPYKTYYIKRKL